MARTLLLVGGPGDGTIVRDMDPYKGYLRYLRGCTDWPGDSPAPVPAALPSIYIIDRSIGVAYHSSMTLREAIVKLASSYHGDGFTSEYNERQKANARLIATSPQLLEALKRLLSPTDVRNAENHDKECRCVIHEAVNAIAAAESIHERHPAIPSEKP